MKALFWAVVIVVAIVLGPFLFIWSLNTLFPTLAIPYSFETWCAAVLINAFISTAVKTKSK